MPIVVKVEWGATNRNIGRLDSDPESYLICNRVRRAAREVIGSDNEPRFFTCTQQPGETEPQKVFAATPEDAVRLLVDYAAVEELDAWIEIHSMPNPYRGKSREQLREILASFGGHREKIPYHELFDNVWGYQRGRS